MNEGQQPGDSATALTVDSAASVLDGLLSGHSEEEQPDDTSDDKTPAAQSSPDDETDDQSDESEEQSNSDDEDDNESSDEDDAEVASDDDEEQPELHAVKVNGEEAKVTLDELKKGYSREKDYTQKSQKLAEDRRKLEAELTPERDAVRAERQRYAKDLSDLETALKSLVQEPDWDKLRAENPEEFADVWAAWNQHKKRLDVIAGERKEADAKVQADFSTAEKARLVGERDKLIAAIPSWSDTKVAKDESDAILTYGEGLGFSKEEIRGVSDHRALVALRKAMLFDRAEADKAKAKKTAVAKIEKVKAAAPGAKGKPKANDTTRAKQRHAKVGSVTSAASALELMFGD